MDEKPSQFDKADSVIARFVDVFMTRTEAMFGKLEPAYATYILERLLLILCHRMTKLLGGALSMALFSQVYCGPLESSTSAARASPLEYDPTSPPAL